MSSLLFLGTLLLGVEPASARPLLDAPSQEVTFNPGVSSQTARFGSRGIYVHDPSAIVKCGREFWIFYTGRGIPSYHSTDLKLWERGPSVFSQPPSWVAKAIPQNRWMYYWAPDVIRLGKRYLLYYAVSVFGKNTSAIGLATNPTLDPGNPKFRWTDQGIVIESAKTNIFNAIDPAVCRDKKGHLWMTFGSYWSGIKLIELDPRTGGRLANDSPMYSLAFNNSIEASYLHYHRGFYYLFVNWGICCRGTNSTYEIRVGRSKTITGPYLDDKGNDMMNGGGRKFLASNGPFIGPGQAGILSTSETDWLSCHFYDGTRHGIPTLAIRRLKWNTNGWPEAE